MSQNPLPQPHSIRFVDFDGHEYVRLEESNVFVEGIQTTDGDELLGGLRAWAGVCSPEFQPLLRRTDLLPSHLTFSINCAEILRMETDGEFRLFGRPVGRDTGLANLLYRISTQYA